MAKKPTTKKVTKKAAKGKVAYERCTAQVMTNIEACKILKDKSLFTENAKPGVLVTHNNGNKNWVTKKQYATNFVDAPPATKEVIKERIKVVERIVEVPAVTMVQTVVEEYIQPRLIPACAPLVGMMR